MANNEPPDWAQPDEKLVQCYANAGTQYNHKYCPRCLQEQPYEHRRDGALLCDNACMSCNSQNAHRGRPCPEMTGADNASLGKKWLDVNWPEHIFQKTDDQIREWRARLKADMQASRSSQPRDQSPYSRGGTRGGTRRGQPHRGNPYSIYDRSNDRRNYSDSRHSRDDRGEYDQDQGRPAKRRREQSPEQRRRREQTPEQKVGIADQPNIDPRENPYGFRLQKIMREKRAKSAASAKTSSGDTVMSDANSDAQLRRERDSLQTQVDHLLSKSSQDMSLIRELESKLVALTTELNTVAASRDDSLAREEKLCEEVNAVTARVQSEASAKFSELQQVISTAAASHSRQRLRLESQVATVLEEKEGLKSQVAALTKEHDGLKSQAVALTKENEGLQSQVAALTQNQARVDELVTLLSAVCSRTNPHAPAGTPTTPMQPEAPGVQEDTVRRSLRRR